MTTFSVLRPSAPPRRRAARGAAPGPARRIVWSPQTLSKGSKPLQRLRRGAGRKPRRGGWEARSSRGCGNACSLCCIESLQKKAGASRSWSKKLRPAGMLLMRSSPPSGMRPNSRTRELSESRPGLSERPPNPGRTNPGRTPRTPAGVLKRRNGGRGSGSAGRVNIVKGRDWRGQGQGRVRQEGQRAGTRLAILAGSKTAR